MGDGAWPAMSSVAGYAVAVQQKKSARILFGDGGLWKKKRDIYIYHHPSCLFLHLWFKIKKLGEQNHQKSGVVLAC